MKYLNHFLGDLFSFIFPDLCILCKDTPKLQHDIFCLPCKVELPYTDSFEVLESELDHKLTGRVNIEHAAYLFHLLPEGNVRKCIHRLKYKNDKDIGSKLGIEFGKEWKKYLPIPDLIIPVPIHYKKKVKRGYNQAALFGKGVAETLNIPMLENVLTKQGHTSSQTKKGRIARLENMKNSMSIKKHRQIQGKSILLVDDVITTGATIEACSTLLSRYNIDKLYIGSIAMSKS